MLLILIWVTVLVVGLAIGVGEFYAREQHNALIASENNEQSLGKDCIKHLQNLTASANANELDINSYGMLNNSQESKNFILWQATIQCLTAYPSYHSESTNMFNLSLN